MSSRRLLLLAVLCLCYLHAAHSFSCGIRVNRLTTSRATARRAFWSSLSPSSLSQWTPPVLDVPLQFSALTKAFEGLSVREEAKFLLPMLCVTGIVANRYVEPFLDKRNPYDGESHHEIVYDQKKTSSFYYQRPWLAASRLLKMLRITSGFNARILMDWKTGKLKEHEQERAKEAAEVLSQLGPTFVKLGQALSIRTDLLPEAYTNALKKLQDSVPQFSTQTAMEILKRELGIKDLSERFQSISSVPFASASIGQVYKARLLDGRDVAVKIQRPNVLDDISLDLFLLRALTPMQVHIANRINGEEKSTQEDLDMALALVDEWGRGLVAEVDYRTEAKNTMQFVEAMNKRGLHAVSSPIVVPELSTSRVIVSQWIDGTRLDRDCSADVPRLCGLALNAYLTMLLDTGVLHCDPHPGNLLRTKDGKLCILDWGMAIYLPKDLQYSLLEFISHIHSEDYVQLAEDLVKLGATPAEKIDELRASGIVNGFAYILRQIQQGGGPGKISAALRNEFKRRYGDLSDQDLMKKAKAEISSKTLATNKDDTVDVDAHGITGLMEMVSQRNRKIFKLPTYMLYVMRAFTTLEGIGLSVDPKYSIFQECYPYLAKRLMTDESPRSKAALRNMMIKDGHLKTDKLLTFSEGFTSYTATTSHVDHSGVGAKKAQEALTELLLDSKGNTVQELLIEGAARFTDSLFRVTVDKVVSSPAGRLLQAIIETPKVLVDKLVPNELKGLMLPFTLPSEISHALINLVQKDDRDHANVQSLQLLFKSLEPKVRKQITDLFRRSTKDSILLPMSLVDSKNIRKAIGRGVKINEKIPVVLKLTRKFGASIFENAADRIASQVKATSQQSSAVEADSEDVEIEVLLTEQLGSLSSATAKALAKVIDSN